ncbi:hypothetical protein JW933_03860, partial [candidate division FCPU426 bacterium]|nr:hypothetical protein [candidate division FCPU426 bacterium]
LGRVFHAEVQPANFLPAYNQATMAQETQGMREFRSYIKALETGSVAFSQNMEGRRAAASLGFGEEFGQLYNNLKRHVQETLRFRGSVSINDVIALGKGMLAPEAGIESIRAGVAGQQGQNTDFADYLAKLRTGGMSFSPYISGANAAQQLGYGQDFAEAYDQLVQKANKRISEQGRLSIEDVIALAETMVNDSQAAVMQPETKAGPDLEELVSVVRHALGQARTDLQVDQAIATFEEAVRQGLSSGSIANQEAAQALNTLDVAILRPLGYHVNQSPLGLGDERAFVVYRINRSETRTTAQGDVNVYFVDQVTRYADGLLRGNPGWSSLFTDDVFVFSQSIRQSDKSGVEKVLGGDVPFKPVGGMFQKEFKKNLEQQARLSADLLRRAFRGKSAAERIAIQENSTAAHETEHEVSRRQLDLQEGEVWNGPLEEERAELKSMLDGEPLHILAHIVELAAGNRSFAWSLLGRITGLDAQQHREIIAALESMSDAELTAGIRAAYAQVQSEWQAFYKQQLQMARQRKAGASHAYSADAAYRTGLANLLWTMAGIVVMAFFFTGFGQVQPGFGMQAAGALAGIITALLPLPASIAGYLRWQVLNRYIPAGDIALNTIGLELTPEQKKALLALKRDHPGIYASILLHESYANHGQGNLAMHPLLGRLFQRVRQPDNINDQGETRGREIARQIEQYEEQAVVAALQPFLKAEEATVTYFMAEKAMQAALQASTQPLTVRLIADNGRVYEISIPDLEGVKDQAQKQNLTNAVYRRYVAMIYAQAAALGNRPTRYLLVEVLDQKGQRRKETQKALSETVRTYFTELGHPFFSKANADMPVAIVPKSLDLNDKQEKPQVRRKSNKQKGIYVGIDVGGQGMRVVVVKDGREITEEIFPRRPDEEALQQADQSLRYRYSFAYDHLSQGGTGEEFSNRITRYLAEIKQAVEEKHGPLTGVFINLPGSPDRGHDRMSSLGNLSRGFRNMLVDFKQANTFIPRMRALFGRNTAFDYGNDTTGWTLDVADSTGVQNGVFIGAGSGLAVKEFENGVEIDGVNEGGHHRWNIKETTGPNMTMDSLPNSFEDMGGSIRGILRLARMYGLIDRLWVHRGRQQLPGLGEVEVRHIGLAAAGIEPWDGKTRLPENHELTKIARIVLDMIAQREAQHILLLHRLTGKTQFVLAGGTMAGETGVMRRAMIQKHVDFFARELGVKAALQVLLVQDASAARGAALKAMDVAAQKRQTSRWLRSISGFKTIEMGSVLTGLILAGLGIAAIVQAATMAA